MPTSLRFEGRLRWMMTDKKRCKTCRWWAGVPGEQRECDCRHPACDSLTPQPGSFRASPACEHDAYFVSGPDFGCVHWEERES